MNKLKKLLDKYKIPYEILYIYNTPSIRYPDEKNLVLDAVCHPHSDGYYEGLLEIRWSDTSEVIGRLTAEDVFNIINDHWEKNKWNLIKTK